MRNTVRSSSEFMNELFGDRKKRNPSYSTRAFARDCGVSTGHLSMILRGRAHLSRKKAESVSAQLKLRATDRDLLASLVEYESARTEKKRRLVMLKRLKFMNSFAGPARDQYRLIADWYHLPVLELTELEGFRPEPAWIARQLGITSLQARSAIERLIRLGLMVQAQDTLKKVSPSVVIPDGPRSDAIQKSHRDLLGLALQALVNQEIGQRIFSSTVIRCRTQDLEKVRARLKTFRQELMVELEAGQGQDSVYLLGMQFFQLAPQDSKAR